MKLNECGREYHSHPSLVPGEPKSNVVHDLANSKKEVGKELQGCFSMGGGLPPAHHIVTIQGFEW